MTPRGTDTASAINFKPPLARQHAATPILDLVGASAEQTDRKTTPKAQQEEKQPFSSFDEGENNLSVDTAGGLKKRSK